jgi:hypothetical protein
MSSQAENGVNEDFLDLLSSFVRANVRFLVVGGYAVAVHGHPRATKDLDLWIDSSAANAKRVIRALREFGAPLGELTAEDLSKPGKGFKMGQPPRRIDVLTEISGVRFDEAWSNHIEATFGAGVACAVIGLDDLLKNKAAASRPQDLADVAALKRLTRTRGSDRKRRGPTGKKRI